eukprot:m.24265 g.24265  ORF g.24265 m.24265 type:complete len:328 (-) comp14518_c0_seq1:38-1021(-)
MKSVGFAVGARRLIRLVSSRSLSKMAESQSGKTEAVAKSPICESEALKALDIKTPVGPTLPQTSFECEAIGFIKTCFKQRFGIPRQPGLAPAAIAQIVLRPPYNHPEAVRGLEGWSHLWITYIFHETVLPKTFKSTVHPPRGKEKYGVFATRTTHRPNRIGLSLVKLERVEISKADGPIIHLSGVDLLDQSPVLDIKPYLPYCEALPNAIAGFAPSEPPKVSVHFSEAAEKQLEAIQSKYSGIKDLAVQVLEQDPRPTFRKRRDESTNNNKIYCHYLCDVKFNWQYEEQNDGDTADTATSSNTATLSKIVIIECSKLPKEEISSLFL